MIFEKLQEDSRNLSHKFIERPWGRFIVLSTVCENGDVIYKQKLLLIKPDVSLKLHKHIDYSEFWIGEKAFEYVLENERGELITKRAEPFGRIFVPKNRKHKIINREQELRILEIQTGLILEEDNIKFD